MRLSETCYEQEQLYSESTFFSMNSISIRGKIHVLGAKRDGMSLCYCDWLLKIKNQRQHTVYSIYHRDGCPETKGR